LLGLKPEEFWKLTPAELAALAEGAQQRERVKQERLAWAVAYLLAPWTKRRITPAMLLGREDAA
jgi:hypothetical protein